MANNLQLLQHIQNAVWNNLLKVLHEAMLSNLLQHIQKAALNNLQLLLPPSKAQLSDPWTRPLLHSLAADPRRPGRAAHQLRRQRRSLMRSKPESKILEKPTTHFAPTMTPMPHSLVPNTSSGA